MRRVLKEKRNKADIIQLLKEEFISINGSTREWEGLCTRAEDFRVAEHRKLPDAKSSNSEVSVVTDSDFASKVLKRALSRSYLEM